MFANRLGLTSLRLSLPQSYEKLGYRQKVRGTCCMSPRIVSQMILSGFFHLFNKSFRRNDVYFQTAVLGAVGA